MPSYYTTTILGGDLPTPARASGQLAWVVLASSVTMHAPALSMQSIVTHLDKQRGSGGGDTLSELSALRHIAPPLLRSSATALLGLLPGVAWRFAAPRAP